MAVAVNGIKKIEIAPIGTGAETGMMPATGYVSIVDIQIGSVSFNIPEVTTTDIRTEDSPGVRWSLDGEGDPPNFNFGTHDLSLETIQLIFGGEIAAGPPAVYSAPAEKVSVQKAVRVTTKDFYGYETVLEFPVTNLVSSLDATFTRDTVSAINVAARVNTPVNQSNVVQPPFTLTHIPVA